MEVIIVVASAYAEGFSKGGGFVASTKSCSTAGDEATAASIGSQPFQMVFPSSCLAEAAVTTTATTNPKPLKRTCCIARFDHDDDDVDDSSRSALPKRFGVVLGRDPASSNVVVKHALAQGALLSRKQCAIRVWFPRSFVHPSLNKAGGASSLPIAFDCVDFGSVNGTFVNGRRLSSASEPCKPILISLRKLFEPVSNASPYGLHVMSLSFGTGARVSEGGSLTDSQTMLVFDVYVRLLRHSSGAIQTKTLLSDEETFVQRMFHDNMPKLEIDKPSVLTEISRTRSRLTMMNNEGEDEPEHIREEFVVEDTDNEDRQQRPAVPSTFGEVTGGAHISSDGCGVFSSRGVTGGMDSPTRSNHKLLLAASSRSAVSMMDQALTLTSFNQRSNFRTEDVLSSILKSHGYLESQGMKEAEVDMDTNHQLATADHSNGIHRATNAVVDAPKSMQCEVVVLETGSVTKDSLEAQVLLQEEVIRRASLPVTSSGSHHTQMVPDAHVEPQIAAAHLEHSMEHETSMPVLVSRRAAPQVKYASIPKSLDLSSQYRGIESCPVYSPPLPASQPEVAEVVKGEPEDGLQMLSQEEAPLLARCKKIDHDPAQSCEPDKQVTNAKKKGGRPKRVTDPAETISMFCEALRSEKKPSQIVASPSNQQAFAAQSMAKILKDSLQFSEKMNPTTRVPFQRQTNEDEEDEEDFPLAMIIGSVPGSTAASTCTESVVVDEYPIKPSSGVAVARSSNANTFPVVDGAVLSVAASSIIDERSVLNPKSGLDRYCVIVPPNANEFEALQCQAEEFIASQIEMDAMIEPQHPLPAQLEPQPVDSNAVNALRPGGCIFLAGKQSGTTLANYPSLHEEEVLSSAGCLAPAPSMAAGQSQHSLQHSRGAPPHETLRCLFDDDEEDEIIDDHHVVEQAAGFSQKHGSASGGRVTSYFEHMKPAVVNPSHHQSVAILGYRSNSKDDIRHHPEGAPSIRGVISPEDGRKEKTDIASVSEPSASSWSFSQGEYVLIATQRDVVDDGPALPHTTSKDREASQQTFQSQMELTTRVPLRRIYLNRGVVSAASQRELPAMSELDAPQLSTSPGSAEKTAAASKVRRVSFNPNVSLVSLDQSKTLRSGTHNLKSVKKQPTTRRARLEALLEVLPSAAATQNDNEENDGLVGQQQPTPNSMRYERLPHWQRSASDIAHTDEHETFSHPSRRVVNVAQGGITIYATESIRSTLKEHQWDAVRFAWANLMREDSTGREGTTGPCTTMSPSAAALSAGRKASSTARRPRDEASSPQSKRPLKKSKAESNGAKFLSGMLSDEEELIDDHHTASLAEKQRSQYDFNDDSDREKHAIAEVQNATPRGCVIAHAMGLGKTLTTLSFLFVLWRSLAQHAGSNASHRFSEMERHGGAHVVICVPKVLVFHWIREIHHWTSTLEEDAVTVFLLSNDTKSDRLSLLKEWAASATENRRSILLISHTTLSSIMMSNQADLESSNTSANSKKRNGGTAKRRCTVSKATDDDDEGFWSVEPQDEEVDEEELLEKAAMSAQRRADRLDYLQKCRAVILETTNVLIADEVHRLHHVGSQLSRALCSFSSPRIARVALTGTPVTTAARDELLAILRFVTPTLWTKRDLSDRALVAEMKKLVHGRGIETLASELPPLVETSIVVRMSPVQQQMFSGLVRSQQERGVIPQRKILETVARTMMISNHSDLVADWCRRRGIQDISQPEAQHPSVQWAALSLSLPSILTDVEEENDHEENDGEPSSAAMRSLDHCWKMRVLIGILHGSIRHGEKVVIFSHSIKTLFLVGRLLSTLGLADGTHFALMDGRIPSVLRDEFTCKFNNPEDPLQILLASFQSCSIGQNFRGAQRVILFEVSWRPILDVQAICRVFRYGQHQTVFVNRLISDNGVERKMIETSNNTGRAKTKKSSVNQQRGDPSSALTLGAIGAEELLQQLMVGGGKNSGKGIQCDDDDIVLAEVLRGATCISEVHRDFSFQTQK